MKQQGSDQTHNKQLQGISLESVLEKRRLDQALNAKEFAVCAGVSYSTARCWFRLDDFPAFRGLVFWDDFVQWRRNHNGLAAPKESAPQVDRVDISGDLPPRAARILQEPL